VLLVEDLGSANGTQVGGQRLGAGQRARVDVGEPLFVGSTVLFVQPATARAGGAVLQTADRFRSDLADACARASRDGEGFSLLALEVLDGFVAERMVESVRGELRSSDLLAACDGCRYAALLWDLVPRAGGPPPALVESLTRLGPAAAWATARFPDDGRAPEALLAHARRRLDQACLAAGSNQGPTFCDRRMERLYELARHAAAGLVSVLILGETGVGKDVMARTIHRLSPRADRPFQRIECAALSEALAESELFGHERGAFTGALRAKPGLLESADGGTVFLDEIGELPPRIQAKLLHVLETRQSTRVGAVRGRSIDVRFIAATNRDLERDVARGLFRKDLYYRLNGFTLAIPPLRERVGEVAPLARALLRELHRQLGRASAPALSAAAMARLEAYAWPGNVRELRNVLERAALLCPDGTINEEHLLFCEPEAEDQAQPLSAPVEDGDVPAETPPSPLDQERHRIEAALLACGGNQTRAARLLGMARSTLCLRLDAHGITRPRKPAADPSSDGDAPT
jgi:DNA-binding NtrC family response regulator